MGSSNILESNLRLVGPYCGQTRGYLQRCEGPCTGSMFLSEILKVDHVGWALSRLRLLLANDTFPGPLRKGNLQRQAGELCDSLERFFLGAPHDFGHGSSCCSKVLLMWFGALVLWSLTLKANPKPLPRNKPPPDSWTAGSIRTRKSQIEITQPQKACLLKPARGASTCCSGLSIYGHWSRVPNEAIVSDTVKQKCTSKWFPKWYW